MFDKIKSMLPRKCHYCNQKINEGITAEVKVPGLVGMHERCFCSEEHYIKYQNYIKEYEKKRKIPMSSSFVCKSCLRK